MSFSATAVASLLSAAADELLIAFAWLSFSCKCTPHSQAIDAILEVCSLNALAAPMICKLLMRCISRFEDAVTAACQAWQGTDLRDVLQVSSLSTLQIHKLIL